MCGCKVRSRTKLLELATNAERPSLPEQADRIGARIVHDCMQRLTKRVAHAGIDSVVSRGVGQSDIYGVCISSEAHALVGVRLRGRRGMCVPPAAEFGAAEQHGVGKRLDRERVGKTQLRAGPQNLCERCSCDGSLPHSLADPCKLSLNRTPARAHPDARRIGRRRQQQVVVCVRRRSPAPAIECNQYRAWRPPLWAALRLEIDRDERIPEHRGMLFVIWNALQWAQL